MSRKKTPPPYGEPGAERGVRPERVGSCSCQREGGQWTGEASAPLGPMMVLVHSYKLSPFGPALQLVGGSSDISASSFWMRLAEEVRGAIGDAVVARREHARQESC